MRGALLVVLASLALAGCPANGNYYGPDSGYYGNGYNQGGYNQGYGGGYNQGYNQGYGGYGNSGPNCSREVDGNGAAFLNCDQKIAGNCSNERTNSGQRYWRCPQGYVGGGYNQGYGGYQGGVPPVEYTGVSRGCRFIAEQYGSGYYICDKPNGMHCDSERTSAGQRYYQCRP